MDAIEELPKDQQAALAAWIAERDQAEWEAEIERDFSPGGALIEEMKADARAGKFHPFAAICRRESLMLRDDPQEADVLAWLEAAGDLRWLALS
jgi:hypothetical protein